MMMLIPISIRLKGEGQRFFPKALRGKLLPEKEAQKVWAEIMQPVKGAKPAPRVTKRRKRS